MFVDSTKIYVKAGDGGNGAVAFHREKYVAAGGPDGGDGGKGGDIILTTDTNLSTLIDLRYKRKYSAQNGEDGKGGKMFGKSGEELVIRVPMGTVVKDAQTGLIIKDMSSSEDFILARAARAAGETGILQHRLANVPDLQNPGFRERNARLYLS